MTVAKRTTCTWRASSACSTRAPRASRVVDHRRKAALARFEALASPPRVTRSGGSRRSARLPAARSARRPTSASASSARRSRRSRCGPLSCTLLAFVNGRFSPELSALRSTPRGVVVSNLASMLQTDPGSSPLLHALRRVRSARAHCAQHRVCRGWCGRLRSGKRRPQRAGTHPLLLDRPDADRHVPRTIIVAGDTAREGHRDVRGADGEKYSPTP